MMKRLKPSKKNGPRAAATARKAKLVASEKPTVLQYRKASLEASAFARVWVARRYRVQSRWAAVIVEVAGLGGRA